MEGIMHEVRVRLALRQNKHGRDRKVPPMLALIFQPSYRVRSTILSLGIVATAMGCTQADRLDSAGVGPPGPSFAPIVAEVMPAVVNVSAVQRVTKAAADPDD